MKSERSYRHSLEHRSLVVVAGQSEEDKTDIPEALIALSRAILSVGGHLRVVAEPHLALLCSFVASEYIKPRFAESLDPEPDRHHVPLVEVFLQHVDENLEMQFGLLQSLGYITRHSGSNQNVLTGIVFDAAVCIGGSPSMDETLVELRRRNRGAPVFALETTGGLARTLASRAREKQDDFGPIVALDTDLLRDLGRRRSELHEEWDEERDFDRRLHRERGEELGTVVVPYSLITQRIAEKLSHRNQGSE